MSEILAPTDRQEMLIAEIRAMAVIAAEEADAEKAIAMLAAVGTIASNLRDFWALQNAELPEVPTADAAPSPQLSVVAPIEIETPEGPVEQPADEVGPPVQETEHPPAVSEIPEEIDEQETEEDDRETYEFDAAPFKDLRLTPRQQAVMERIDALRGQRFKKSHVVSQLEGSLSAASAGSAFKEVISLLRSRAPFSGALERDGVRGGVTYVWHGLEVASAEDNQSQADNANLEDEPLNEPPKESANRQKHTVTEAEHGKVLFKVAETLEKIGITVAPQSRDRLQVRGVPMNLTELSVLTVLILAEFSCKADYKTLVMHPKMQQLRRVNKNLDNELHVSLAQIEREMQRFDIPWSDTPLMREGKKVRRLRLGEEAVTSRA